MSSLLSMLFVVPSPSTCSASYAAFLISLSPAVCALVSATALWVAARARSISKDAQQTSQAATTLSLLGTDSRLAMGEQAPPAVHAKP
jgi:hypothetical protein